MMRNSRQLRILLIILCCVCSNSEAWNLGGAVTGANEFFREQQRQEEIDRQRQRHEFEMERMRLQNEIQQRQIENARREAADKEQSRERTEATARATVQEAINQVPALKNWQANDPVRWSRAREIDAVMRQLPENANLTLVERFRKVVRYVELEFQVNKAP